MKSALFFLTPLLASPAIAQEPTPAPTTAPAPSADATTDDQETVIVVTAERNTQALVETPSTVTVINREQIEAKVPFDITELFRLAPGISVAQTGSQGKGASVFLRGTNSNHTLVLLDGVRANSPADGRFDFGTIPAENIERIEVLRGPQSALYGSDAIGGVINIITRRGQGPLRTGGQLEFGSDSINKQVVTARGSVGKGGLSFSATRLKSGGITTNDDYKNLGASLRYDLPLSQGKQITFLSRVDDAEVGTPGQTAFGIDPNARSKPRDLFGSIQFTNAAGKRNDRIVLGAFDRNLKFTDEFNPGVPADRSSSTDSVNKNRVLTLDAQSAFALGSHTLTVGGEARRESTAVDSQSIFGGFPANTNFSKSTHTEAIFLQDEFRAGRLTLVPSARYERNSQFGNDTNGRFAAAYNLSSNSKLKASVGTAFKAPSFNDLYFPNYGTPTLKPEESTGYEIGYEHGLPRGGRFEVTAFQNKIKNLIAGVAAPTPANPFRFIAANINRATTEGLEFGLDLPLARGIRIVANHAFLNTDSQPNLVRRPKFASTADLIMRRGKINADLGLIAQGRRYDNDFQAPGVGRGAGIYGGFTRFDLTLGYDVRPGIQVYGRLQNVLDKEYEEAAGFRTPGRNFVIGLRTSAF